MERNMQRQYLEDLYEKVLELKKIDDVQIVHVPIDAVKIAPCESCSLPVVLDELINLANHPIYREKNKKGSITLLCGPSGSGKSTYLKNNPVDNSVVICPDDYRHALLGTYFYKQAEDFIWSIVKLNVRVMASTQKYHVFLDATSLNSYSRKQWVLLAKELEIDCNCVVFHIDKETCKVRNAQRERQVPEDVIDRQFRDFEDVSVSEGFKNVIHVNQE